jgi:hypothetical protein
MLLQPTNASQTYCTSLKLNIDDTEPARYRLCTKLGCKSIRDMNVARNTKCRCASNSTLYSMFRPVSLKNFCKGFVNDGTSFVITDNLAVMPNSVQFTSISLFQTLGINGTTSVKELIVNVTKDTVMHLHFYFRNDWELFFLLLNLNFIFISFLNLNCLSYAAGPRYAKVFSSFQEYFDKFVFTKATIFENL